MINVHVVNLILNVVTKDLKLNTNNLFRNPCDLYTKLNYPYQKMKNYIISEHWLQK